ncbi:hypothetical protein [Lentilactobacillus sunkii]|uniref:Uncharacterized protein n=1 Tax=Lentilactobacillus sunkii DSM 19904 TaxID=1423808 RepID=A0A0R1L0R4_9LACO|nr:hypothetical protein [Lentilactobacillus sunkii]KRK89446.1 hypothetical protein FD17_GL001031 [Lentilactobacillus sunkii DSM 19904]
MAEDNNAWKEALKSESEFRDYITNYFKDHEELTGSYDIPSYYEHYTVRLDSHKGIIITLVTGVQATGGESNLPLPFKQKEVISIEDFRKLILHKKFADQSQTLADVFQTVAGIPSANNDSKDDSKK